MSQLELILKDDVSKLIPAMIAWNNKELMAQVNEILPRYLNAEYGDDISQAKEDRTALNNFIKTLNSKRLEIKKVYTAPLDKFTEEVNEVIAAVTKATDRIGEIITTAENKVKAEKKIRKIKAKNVYFLPLGTCEKLKIGEKIELKQK